MIAIINYGVGNLFSLRGSLKHLGIEAEVTADPERIDVADRIILPGVGAFGDAMEKLREHGLLPVLDRQAHSGKPFLGICLGMQVLFEWGYEFGAHKGLGYLKGSVHALADDLPADMKIPHIGWNSLKLVKPEDPLLRYTKDGDYVYYVHSFYVKGCEESLIAGSDYGTFIPGAVHKGNIWGTQFHPEKSGITGLSMLRAFAEASV
ncbi:MAG: imidazole glycerol phosphate synthase subunit HisH [Candidatus Pelethousia sp.]|nr:imidazole glycerol phosphate synthase subunit HisH [Candidatus Pelethousia sp.]